MSTICKPPEGDVVEAEAVVLSGGDVVEEAVVVPNGDVVDDVGVLSKKNM